MRNYKFRHFKRDILARIKHPILWAKFEVTAFKLGVKAAMIKGYWDNMLFDTAVKMTEEAKPLMYKLVDILIGMYDTDFDHVRVEINPKFKYGLGMYVNR